MAAERVHAGTVLISKSASLNLIDFDFHLHLTNITLELQELLNSEPLKHWRHFTVSGTFKQ